MGSLSGRLQAILWCVVVTSVISLLGAGVWSALITTNLLTTPAIPWAIPAMGVVLWLMWQYLGGKWWPRSTSQARQSYLRANRVPSPLLGWALAASALALIALVGFWIVLVELAGSGGNPTIPDYSRYPLLTVVLGLLMGSLVSPLTEEAAFRGYAQVRLGAYSQREHLWRSRRCCLHSGTAQRRASCGRSFSSTLRSASSLARPPNSRIRACRRSRCISWATWRSSS